MRLTHVTLGRSGCSGSSQEGLGYSVVNFQSSRRLSRTETSSALVGYSRIMGLAAKPDLHGTPELAEVNLGRGHRSMT